MKAIVLMLIPGCILAALSVPALIGVKLFRNAVGGRPSPAIVFKAGAGLVVWFLLTAGLFVHWAVLAYVVPHALSSEQTAEWQPTTAYIGAHVGYLLIGCGIVYCVWRQEKVRLP